MGDTIEFNNVTFTVLSTRGRRITKVRVERNQQPLTTAVQEVENGQSSPLLLPLPKEKRETEDTQQDKSNPSHYEYKGA